MGRRDGAAVRRSALQYVPEARAGGDVARGIMVPGSPRVRWKMATPRRYVDKGFMRTVAPEIYGGAFAEIRT